jgi:PKD repeat protein
MKTKLILFLLCIYQLTTAQTLSPNFEVRFNGVLKTNIERGQALTFTDLSSGAPSSWEWKFEGGTPETATSQNVTVTYNTPGTFSVVLTISDGTTTQSVTRVNYILVSATYNKGQAYTCIAIDSAKNIWAGTNKAGVFFLDKKTTPAAAQFDLLSYTGNNFDPAKFVIQSMACDRLGNTWVAHGGTGTTTGLTGGMERIDYNNPSTIQHYTPTSETRCLKLGDNDGLATRNIQSVVVDKNNTVWSAHRYHDLTSSPNYYVTPGSFSYKTSSASVFTSKSTWADYQNNVQPPELPYPAYTCNPTANQTAQTRTCNSIACGPNDVWVSVYPYQSVDGESFPARLLRYDLNGNFIPPAIDFSTLGIPVGGVFNGIYISPKGQPWVTLSAGKGFATRVNGEWRVIKPGDLPCVLPASAVLNQNAIWGNKFGNVYIGTSQGLIVYKGDGDVSSVDSYSSFSLAKDNGTARNVTGGVSENDSIQWVATDDGIVRTVIGRVDMTKNDVDYTSCNNVDMNAVEDALKTGTGNASYHNYSVVTVICDRATTKHPNECTAEYVFNLMKNQSELSSPIPEDYPENLLDIYREKNSVFFSLLTTPPFISAIAALTNSSQTAEQIKYNNPAAVSCERYRLYGNMQSVIMHYLFDKGPTHRYFKECNWLWLTLTLPAIDFSHSMDDYCGDKLLDVQYDPIWKFVDEKHKTIVNYTANGHVLYPGKVTTTVVEECGVVKTVVSGVGLQYCGDNCRGELMGIANSILGEHLFIQVNKRLQKRFEQ